MVGRDQVERAIAQRLPQQLAIRAAANRRGALEQRRPIRNLFRATVQIVRTGLNGHIDSFALCRTNYLERLCRRQVHDM